MEMIVRRVVHYWRPFEEARVFVHTLELKSVAEWEIYCKSGQKPEDVPAYPPKVYRSEFQGYGDWLGTGTIAPFLRQYRPFQEARAFIHTQGLQSREEWTRYCKSGKKPQDIPVSPRQVYKSEFKGMGDWLGTGYIAGILREYLPFEEAQIFVHTLKLKNVKEWQIYCKSTKKPVAIPTNPHRVYKNQFTNWGDWLGTRAIGPHNRSYRLFLEARAFVQSLGLKNVKEWHTYCRSGKKPEDIPTDPRTVYQSKFQGYGDWLGTGVIASRLRQYLPFEEARAFVHLLRLKGKDAWGTYCTSEEKPEDIPAAPHYVYKSEFKGWGDWLGTGTIAPRLRQYLPFEEARTFVHSLALRSGSDWKTYCKSSSKPANIPSEPRRVYKSEFISMGDWLGTGYIAGQLREYLSFEEARTFVHSLALRSGSYWKVYCKSGAKPQDIPMYPEKVYSAEYQGMQDWLGASYNITHKHQFLPFEQARAFVHSLGFKNGEEWQVYCASGKKPNTIPASPSHAYNTEFKGMGDWLGTGTLSPHNRTYLPFMKARTFVHTLNLRNNSEWRTYCKSGNRPVNIPTRPERIYLSEFIGYGDWLGTGRDYRAIASK